MGADGSTSSKESIRAALVDVVTALSLANLCYLPVWYATIRVSLNPQAQWANYSRNGCIAAMLGVLVLAAVLWASARTARRRRSITLLMLRDVAFLAACLHVSFAVAQGEAPAALRSAGDVLGAARVPIALLLMATVALMIRSPWRNRLVSAGRAVVLLLAPFVLFTFSQAGWLLPQFAVPEPAPAGVSGAPSTVRVVWVVFDELDQNLAFDARPDELVLSELDRLRATAVAMQRAYPPADTTLLSIPSLLTGAVVARSKPAGPSDRVLVFAGDGEPARSAAWSNVDNVFDRARQRGVSSGLTGWYHPYDRILGSDLVRCHNRNPRDATLATAALAQMRRLIATPPFGWLADPVAGAVSDQSSRHLPDVQRYRQILADATAMASDRQLGLVFVHASIPHLPVIYDRHRERLGGTSSGSYLDNLALVDLTIGELRRSLETAGMWDATALIITSDHALKTKRLDSKLPGRVMNERDRRVPFLLKMPHQRTAVMFERPWNTVATEKLVLAILDGTVADAAAAVEWLNQRATY